MHGHVRSLTGNVPEALGHLRLIARLKMSNNQLQGAPCDCGLLMDLSLYTRVAQPSAYDKRNVPTRLSAFPVCYPYAGTLPRGLFSSMGVLTSIDMANNLISGSIPTSIGWVTPHLALLARDMMDACRNTFEHSSHGQFKQPGPAAFSGVRN